MTYDTEWPPQGREDVPACPVCGGRERDTLHEGLQDHAFGVAPGRWALKSCKGCRCAYLDPRPTAATIGLAYARYYTHQRRASSPARPTLRRRFAEAYLNARFGTSYPDAIPGGQYVAMLFPRKRLYLDVYYSRHLERADGGNRRLLDVGCGNGEFLGFAARLGWQAEGMDVDPAAVAAAREEGLAVTQGSLDELPFPPATFRHITLSHVIEHVHDPVKLLRQCLALLEPGGRLWLQTPNLDAFGHSVFGASWRGLEPPRHLVLFGRQSLSAALAAAGFAEPAFHAHPGVTTFMWEESRRIAASSGRQPQGLGRLLGLPPGAAIAEWRAVLDLDLSEFLTCTAARPSSAGTAP